MLVPLCATFVINVAHVYPPLLHAIFQADFGGSVFVRWWPGGGPAEQIAHTNTAPGAIPWRRRAK